MTRYTDEYINLAKALTAFYDKNSKLVFAYDTSLSNFYAGYRYMIVQLHDMCSRVPMPLSKKREDFLSTVLCACSFASMEYNYYSSENESRKAELVLK